MKRYFVGLALLASLTASAQRWESRIGLNLLPLVARTLEVRAALHPTPAWALTLDVGGTLGSRFQGLSLSKVGDDVSGKRRTSGAYLRAGGKVYWKRLANPVAPVSFLTGLSVVASAYRAVARVQDWSTLPPDPAREETRTSRGFLWGLGLTGGLAWDLNRRFSHEIGVQYCLHPPRTDYFGLAYRNYQPGMGVLSERNGGRDSWQLFWTVNYRLGR
jgi:hypothetical protein